MREISPIRIHPSDDDEAMRKRHEEIERRLEELGEQRVGILLGTGGLPTNWGTIVNAWLAGHRLKREGA